MVKYRLSYWEVDRQATIKLNVVKYFEGMWMQFSPNGSDLGVIWALSCDDYGRYGSITEDYHRESLLTQVNTLTCIRGLPGSYLGRSYWDFYGFTQFFQVNARIILQIRSRPLPSTSFPVHYSLLILLFNVKFLQPEMLTASLNKNRVLIQQLHAYGALENFLLT
jgi:hypothetical protein